MATIGIIGAMQSEIDEFCALSNANESETKGFYKGFLHGHTVIVAMSGVGKVNAAICTQKMIDIFKPDYIINSGVAGGLCEFIKKCDIVISESLIYHDFNPLEILLNYAPFTTAFKADKLLISYAEKSTKELCENSEIKFSAHTGTIVSGDCFVSSSEKANELNAKFGALCTEMEGAAIAHTCTVNNVPFLVLRSISDFADNDAESSFESFETVAAKHASCIVSNMIKYIK